jgi:hypothetical protein
MMDGPTPQHVKNFWAYMSKEYDSTVIQKADSELMKVVAWFLDVVNVQEDEQFMKDFTTTLWKRIYIPFELGVGDGDTLWRQIRTCVHEHQHIEQGERDGWLEFGGKYLTSPSFRANYEAEAYGCDMELEYWRNPPSDFDALQYGLGRIESLKNYGCSAEDIEQAKQTIVLRAEVLEKGGVENKASQIAISWLNDYAPELCGL